MDEIRVERIIRSRRKTLALEVTPAATLIVRAPLRASTPYIEEMIREKSVWILQKMEEIKRRPVPQAHEFREGELFLFLGREYPLHIIDDEKAAIERSDKLNVSRTLLPDIRDRLKHWYREEARKEIKARCMWFSLKTGHVPSAIRITDARQCWGSCTHRGGINFSWRLIQAPLEIVDYVIVHELVHINQPDHSKKFWDNVRKLMPDYEQRRNWLKDHEWLLKI